MNKQVKQKWLAALRGGEYQQVTRKLRDNNGFCCLGVLCDLYRKEMGLEWVEDGYGGFELLEAKDILPKLVVEWAGLPDTNPDVTHPDFDKAHPDYSITCVAALNDSGKSFEEIADIIEAQL